MSVRVFAAIDIPDDVAARLIALQKGVPGASWRPRENLHLTLRFFGEIPEDAARDLDAELGQEADGAAPFEIALKGAGSFGKDDPHTIYIGVAPSEPLRRLAADLERAARRAGLKPETRKYAPHVTLAYLRGGVDLGRVQSFEQRCALFETPAWRVDRFFLYSSWLRRGEPSLYRIEAEYPLGGSVAPGPGPGAAQIS